MIRGKGYYVWNADVVLRRSAAASAQDAAMRACAAGVEHVIVKIADGKDPYPLPGAGQTEKEAITGALIDALRNAGIAVWGWAFAYGPPLDPETQAAVFAERARHFGLNGLVIDAEDYQARNQVWNWSCPEGPAAARAYVQRLRAAMSEEPKVADLIVGLSSYRYIRYHEDFPFADFMSGCDLAMPQVYWMARPEGDAVRNLQDCYEDYKQRFPTTLFVPTGAAFGEAQGPANYPWFWSASPQQITRFLDQARAMRLPAVTFWSWEHTLHDPGNSKYPNTELWDAVAAYAYHPGGQILEADGPISVPVNGSGYSDGLQAQMPDTLLHTFARDGRVLKYAPSVEQNAGVWALWQPRLPESGRYAISVWVPAVHATTRHALYQIHGVVGQPGPIQFQVNQDRFFDEWVSLGVYDLDAAQPQSGHILLTNATGEAGREVGFADITWQPVKKAPEEPGRPLADGFDAPVGTEAERRSTEVWPGKWFDASPYDQQYLDSTGSAAFHTGADLNLNDPVWDSDANAPVYAPASGEVTFAGQRSVWGNIVIIRHDPLQPGGDGVCSRSAHLATVGVAAGQRVQRGQQIGCIGHPAGGPNHLHFDISPTKALLLNPGDWPGLDRPRLHLHYLNPLTFIQQHRA
jgi:murein DD-endopeptidase MepM/ murein hydrolase activator NlpD